MKTIYFDLDGVLADFYGEVTRRTGKLVYNQETAWDIINADPEFFENLPVLPGAKETVDFATALGLNVRILTATGNNYSDVMPQKVKWVIKNIGLRHDQITIVKSGKDKQWYANNNSILVDDTPAVLHLWKAQGGTPLLHTDHGVTQEVIKMFLGD